MNIQSIASMIGFDTASAYRTQSAGNQDTTEDIRESSSVGNSSYDVNDLNGDGIVSPLEEYMYELMHPEESTSMNMPSQYDSNGTIRTSSGGVPKMINITV